MARKFTYNDFLVRVRVCVKCGANPPDGKKMHPGYLISTGSKCPPYPWNRKDIDLEDVVGYCAEHRPKREESAKEITQGAKQITHPRITAPDSEKYAWVSQVIAKLSLEILEVFGEVKTLEQIRDEAKAWRKAQAIADEAKAQKDAGHG